MTRSLRILALALAILGIAAPSALAHAQLEGTVPARGDVVRVQPKQVVFEFSEGVEGSFGAVRVFNAAGSRVDDGQVAHPAGDGSKLGVGLKPRLADGSYTATYRVISADGHPVSGGMVFSIGRAGRGPAKTVDQLIGSARTGTVTKAAAEASAGLVYLATALTLGVLAFVLLCWGSGASRVRELLLDAVLLGVLASAAGIVLEGAQGAGTSFWSALDVHTVREVLHTRFGTIWAIRLVVFLVLGGLLSARRPRLAVIPALGLALLPALEGHSATLSPSWLLIPLDTIHVGAMSLWLGGLITLLFVVPRATRTLEPPERSRLLAAILVRFSPLALGAVLALLSTGAVAAIAFLTRIDQLWETGYGREIVVKVLLLSGLVALGAVNRQRVVPRLREIAARGEAPGAVGLTLRTTLRAEVLLVVAVLGVSSVLVDGVPPVSAASGPYSASTKIGPLDLELTVDPAQSGANEMHLYLFESRDGTPFDGTKEIDATVADRAKGIGPLPVTLRKSGPGHYVADTLQIAPAGTWTLTVTDRVSDFDEHIATLKVPIR